MLWEQVKVQSGQIMIVGAVSFPGNEIAFRSPFKELGHNLTRCMVREKGNSRREEKEPSSSFHSLCDTGLETV